MTTAIKPVYFHHSRLWAILTLKWWTALIFPKRIRISATGVETLERLGVLFFWRKEVERLPISRLSSVVVKSGIIWDTIQIETSGGSNALVLKGYSKLKAGKLRKVLQGIMNTG
jgi:hypothetical protein